MIDANIVPDSSLSRRSFYGHLRGRLSRTHFGA
jgi:hypothetical protein